MRKLSHVLTYLGVLFIAALTGGATAVAQSGSAPAVGSQAQSHPSGKPGEGIKVHGHWTIDVRNADGTLAWHNEFENALVPSSGAQALSALLTGTKTFGRWEVSLIGATGACSPEGELAVPIFCQIAPQFATGGSSDTVELTGNVTASHADPITQVISRMQYGDLTNAVFTERTLATPIQVAPGQTIYVRVVFSFS